MRISALVLCIILSGCSASPEKLDSVGETEAARMAPPVRRFSSYGNYELRPMILSPAVRIAPEKVAAAGTLENTLRAKLQPLIERWNAASSNRASTLVIEPQLASLRIVSGGARFWAGAFAGDSSIDLDLAVTDQSTGEQVARPRIILKADAWAGGWSVGKSDKNLLDYIASVAYAYMMMHY